MIMNVNPKNIKLTVVSDPDARQYMTNGWEARVREMFICLLPSTSQTGSNNMSNEGDFGAFILSAIGDVERRTEHRLDGHLDELNVANTCSGSFKVTCTDDSFMHLTFTEVDNQPTICLFSLKTIQKLYICDRTGITK